MGGAVPMRAVVFVLVILPPLLFYAMPANADPAPTCEPPVDACFGPPAIAVSAGGSHTCALVSGGNVRCWGSDGSLQSTGYFGGNSVGVSAGDSVGVGDDNTCVL